MTTLKHSTVYERSEKLHCLVCGGQDAEFWARAKDSEYYSSNDWFTYYLCRRCGNLFIDPVPSDRLSEIYPPNYHAYWQKRPSFINALAYAVQLFIHKLTLKRILSQITGDEINVLDVGGASGSTLEMVREIDARVCFT
ncbi:MAG: hypothetical protein ACE5H0_15000, partial [Bacteroidota bacterium]